VIDSITLPYTNHKKQNQTVRMAHTMQLYGAEYVRAALGGRRDLGSVMRSNGSTASDRTGIEGPIDLSAAGPLHSCASRENETENYLFDRSLGRMFPPIPRRPPL
jgi:hypothetical protein